jgi:general secretion pathway protein L
MTQAWLYLPTMTVDMESPVFWWQNEDQVEQGTLQQVAGLTGVTLNLLLPAEVASHHHIEVPPRSGRWLKQAIHSMVEDQLLEEPDQVHLARSNLYGRRHYRLFAVQNQWLEHLLSVLEKIGLTPENIYIDADCLPATKPLALRCQNRWLIGGAFKHRMALDNQALEALAPLLGDDLQYSQESPWPILVQGSTEAINLRQGKFALNRPARMPWRTLVAIAFLAYLAQVAQDIGYTVILENSTKEIGEASTALWRQRFPEEAPIVDLKRQVQARSQQVEPHRSTFAQQLESLANHWVDSSGNQTRIRRLNYIPTEGLGLEVISPDFVTLESLREHLAKNGTNVQSEAAELTQNGVNARLKISE